MSRIRASVVAEVLERAQGCCEACGGAIHGRSAFHHRHPRGRGGSRLPWIDTAVNLMLLHGDYGWNCHNLTEYSVHQNPARSYRLGHSVHYGLDPATVAVLVEPRLRLLRA